MDPAIFLPIEIFLEVLERLNNEELAVCCQVSSYWRHLASCDGLWRRRMAMEYPLESTIPLTQPSGPLEAEGEYKRWYSRGRRSDNLWSRGLSRRLELEGQLRNVTTLANGGVVIASYTWHQVLKVFDLNTSECFQEVDLSESTEPLGIHSFGVHLLVFCGTSEVQWLAVYKWNEKLKLLYYLYPGKKGLNKSFEIEDVLNSSGDLRYHGLNNVASVEVSGIVYGWSLVKEECVFQVNCSRVWVTSKRTYFNKGSVLEGVDESGKVSKCIECKNPRGMVENDTMLVVKEAGERVRLETGEVLVAWDLALHPHKAWAAITSASGLVLRDLLARTTLWSSPASPHASLKCVSSCILLASSPQYTLVHSWYSPQALIILDNFRSHHVSYKVVVSFNTILYFI